MTKIRDKLQIIGTEIETAVRQYHRAKNSVQLLAVSKRHPVEVIREAYLAGQTAFGENYVQELTEKAEELHDLKIDWHFVRIFLVDDRLVEPQSEFSNQKLLKTHLLTE